MFFSRPNPVKDHLSRCRTIAVVGLSDDPYRASHRIASYLQGCGYKIIPVNPFLDEVLGEKAYPDLKSIPVPVDLVDVFRAEDDILPVVKEALEKDIPAIWLQVGLRCPEGEELARDKGVLFIQDRCIMAEHRRLIK